MRMFFSRCKRFLGHVLLLLAISVSGCATAIPPAMYDGPSGDGWKVYNQSYHRRAMSQTTSSNSNEYSTTTTTTTSHQSSNKILEGSFLVSQEPPVCLGYAWIRDCVHDEKEKQEGK